MDSLIHGHGQVCVLVKDGGMRKRTVTLDGCTLEFSPLPWSTALEYFDKIAKSQTPEEQTALAIEACALALDATLCAAAVDRWTPARVRQELDPALLQALASDVFKESGLGRVQIKQPARLLP
jgi:hypothetical protein